MRIESYDLDLDVDFDRARLRGTVGITVEGAQSPLSLDASKLKVRSVRIDGRPARFRVDGGRSKLIVYSVPKKRSLVEVTYDKEVSDDSIFGLYKAKYGKEYMLATDLEPAEARTVFPCKDEPLYKAVFRLQLTTRRGLAAIANTPARRVELTEDQRTRFVFEETPRMSTYLLFFAIGRIEELSLKAGDVEVIGATRPGQAKDSRFALEVVAGVLDLYQKYFGVPYPLPKLHIVAVPEYHTGAMENWGAIASRESRVLINDESSFSEHTHAARTLTHEVGHQWFGDLVTMKWWDDLWLNESFATLMEYKILDMLHPEWDQWNEFLRSMTFRALNLDALSTTHPVQVEVDTVEEVTHFFDVISYNKGSAVLRMLEAYVGEDAFRRGVSDYLKKYSYSNATGSDLWRALGAASSLPVAKVARAWLTQSGFPLVRVSKTRRGTRLTQSQFRLTGPPAPTLWPIPLRLRRDGEEESTLMSARSITIPRGAGPGLLLNPGRVGFYSVLYDEQGWDAVAHSFSSLDSTDRAGVMTDLFLFLQAGLIEPELYFRFVSLAGTTPDPLTTETTATQLHELRAIADEAPILRSAYQKFYPPLMRQIGETPRPGEPETMAATREMLMIGYAQVDPPYARKLSDRFQDYLHLDPNLREAVAISFALTKGEAARGPLLKLVKSFDSEVDRGKIYAALSSFTDPRLVEATLELVVSGEVSRSDSAYPLLSGARNPGVRAAYWSWLTKRYEVLRRMYGNSQQFYLFMALCIPYCGVGRDAEVKRFLSGRRQKEGGSTYARTLELLGIHSRLRDRLLGATKKQD